MKTALINRLRIASAVLAVHLFSTNTIAIQITGTSSPNAIIPDGDLTGLVDVIDLSTSITSIGDVIVTLNISGGYNGDFYAYLRHTDSSGTAFSVLLNRIGVAAGTPFGSSDNGLNIALSDAAGGNVHDGFAGGSVLTGTYQPDGRNVNPLSDPAFLVSASSAAQLDTFQGMNANGRWELFVADVSSGSVGILASWALTISDGAVASVPDGAATLLLLGASSLILAGARQMSGARCSASQNNRRARS